MHVCVSLTAVDTVACLGGQAGGAALPPSDLSTLVGTMEAYPGDLAVQELGCGAIVALCASAENRTSLVRLQAADRVFTALQRHDGDQRLQAGAGDVWWLYGGG